MKLIAPSYQIQFCNFKLHLIVLLFSLLIACHVKAVTQCEELYKGDDHYQAIEVCRKEAKSGNDYAYMLLGYLYADSPYLKEEDLNFELGIDYLKKFLNTDTGKRFYPAAAEFIGSIYEYEGDIKSALRWYFFCSSEPGNDYTCNQGIERLTGILDQDAVIDIARNSWELRYEYLLDKQFKIDNSNEFDQCRRSVLTLGCVLDKDGKSPEAMLWGARGACILGTYLYKYSDPESKYQVTSYRDQLDRNYALECTGNKESLANCNLDIANIDQWEGEMRQKLKNSCSD